MEDFIDFKEELKNRLQINAREVYLFLDDGSPLLNHLDIICSHNKEHRAVFLGGCGGFGGVNSVYMNEEARYNLVKVIH